MPRLKYCQQIFFSSLGRGGHKTLKSCPISYLTRLVFHPAIIVDILCVTEKKHFVGQLLITFSDMFEAI